MTLLPARPGGAVSSLPPCKGLADVPEPRGHWTQQVTLAAGQKSTTDVSESVFGLSLPSAELVFRPCVFQFQLPLLGLQGWRGRCYPRCFSDSAAFRPPPCGLQSPPARNLVTALSTIIPTRAGINWDAQALPSMLKSSFSWGRGSAAAQRARGTIQDRIPGPQNVQGGQSKAGNSGLCLPQGQDSALALLGLSGTVPS